MTDLKPCILERKILPKVWGGRGLETVLGLSLPEGESIGESWELYDRPDGAAEIANGPLTGKTVASFRGERRIPLLTKVIDAMDTLSVQVHPDEEAAIELDGEAKSEAWFSALPCS